MKISLWNAAIAISFLLLTILTDTAGAEQVFRSRNLGATDDLDGGGSSTTTLQADSIPLQHEAPTATTNDTSSTTTTTTTPEVTTTTTTTAPDADNPAAYTSGQPYTSKQCAYLIDSVNSYNPGENANQPPMDQCHEMSMDSSNEECEKCCSYAANELMKDGFGGGFTVEYAVPIERGQKSPSEEAAICYAYVDALHDTLCSPYQGSFITDDNRFLIAQEACDAVYEECVPTGIVSASFAGANGTEFCQRAWGDPCAKAPNAFPCRALLSLEVVPSTSTTTIGITIVQPTHVVIIHYQEESHGTNPWKVSSIVAWTIILIIIFVVACCFFSTSF